MAKCHGKTKSGQPCKMAAINGGQFCFSHSPATRAQQAAARKRGGRNRSRHAGNPATIPTEIKSLDDANKLLAYTVQELLILDNGVQRARALLQAFEMCLKSFEIGELEARIKALEESQQPVNVWPFSPKLRDID
jgi:hypothetical protein